VDADLDQEIRSHIGIRMAPGAQRRDILGMVLRKGLVLVAAGVVAGLGASFAVTRLLSSAIWGLSANDPWTFSAVVAVVVTIAGAACFLPERRATHVDLLVALRYEYVMVLRTTTNHENNLEKERRD
jgi:putative ABC transport system permease protein